MEVSHGWVGQGHDPRGVRRRGGFVLWFISRRRLACWTFSTSSQIREEIRNEPTLERGFGLPSDATEGRLTRLNHVLRY